jgi:hypothetical protein
VPMTSTGTPSDGVGSKIHSRGPGL